MSRRTHIYTDIPIRYTSLSYRQSFNSVSEQYFTREDMHLEQVDLCVFQNKKPKGFKVNL